MADSLRLRNYTELTEQTGNEITLNSDARKSGNKISRWWGRGFTKSTSFDVALSNGHSVRLVIAGEDINIIITHDGAGAFEFPSIKNVERIGVFNVDTGDIISEYSISKRGSNPTLISIGELPKDPEIGSVLISGAAKVSMDSPATAYAFTTSGNAKDLTSTFSTTDSKAEVKSNVITFSSDGSYKVSVTVTSSSASDSPKTASLNVIVSKATSEDKKED